MSNFSRRVKIFAIADLHLSFARPKPMDIFGDHWREHDEKIATAWRACVSEEDIVLVAGDVSWALKSSMAEADLAWLRALPGTKVLVKGNHDYWYPKSHKKRGELLGSGLIGLSRSSAVLDDIGFIGGKGASVDSSEVNDESVMKRDIDKQLRYLGASLADLEARSKGTETRVALLHYPPIAPGEHSSPFTDFLERAGVSLCVYGHLHRPEDFERAFQGKLRGIEYRLTSADYLDFRPLDVTSLL